jgi:hypothetical protein
MYGHELCVGFLSRFLDPQWMQWSRKASTHCVPRWGWGSNLAGELKKAGKPKPFVGLCWQKQKSCKVLSLVIIHAESVYSACAVCVRDHVRCWPYTGVEKTESNNTCMYIHTCEIYLLCFSFLEECPVFSICWKFNILAIKRNKEKYIQALVWWLTPIILVIWEAEIRRITFWGQPGQNVCETLFQQINQVWWHMSVIPVTWEA